MGGVLCVILVSLYIYNSIQPEVTAKNAVVMNVATDDIYFHKNEYEKIANASTTKIMTCILALENLDLNEQTLKVIEDDIVRGSKMGLEEGESLPVSEMLYGMMLASGNEAANVIARTVSKRVSGKGTYEDFALLMDAKAAELGMKDTSFKNPNGLDEEDHYTTARDMAVLTKYAMQNEVFRTIVSTKEYTIASDVKGAKKKYVLENTNELLGTYDGCKGVKTGTTKKAGACLVSYSESEDGTGIIAVLFGSTKEERYNDAIKLLDYGMKKASRA